MIKSAVYILNFMSHHLLPFSLELLQLTHGNYYFIATTPTPKERIDLGYSDYNNQFPWIIKTYESKEAEEHALKICEDADLLISGLYSDQFVRNRAAKGKLTFYYSERVFKKGFIGTISGKGLVVPWPDIINFKYNKQNWIWRGYKETQKNPNVYMLCASCFAAGDFALARLFRDRCYKWGYFTDVIRYNNYRGLMKSKDCNSILWVGRLMQLKHPEYAVNLAQKLKKEGIHFSMTIIGDGPLKRDLENMITDYQLSDCVDLLGSIDHERVRQYMEKAEIFLFTSNFEEGWGAVLNESMNSSCAVVVSDAIGSSGFLIKNNENGLLFHNENEKDLYKKVKRLLNNHEECQRLGKNAYHTLLDMWNPQTAAKRVIELADCLMNDQNTPFEEGPCSKAKVIIRGKVFHK